MYDTNNNVEDSTIKFNMFLKSYINSSLSKAHEIDKKLKSGSLYDELLGNKRPLKFVQKKEEILKVDSSLERYTKIIDYFVKNNVTNVPQIEEAMNAILDSESMTKKKKGTELKEQKKNLEEERDKCKRILNGEMVEYDFYLSMLEKSFLTNREVLDLLISKCYESTKLIRERDLVTPDIVDIREEYNVDDLIQKYNELKIKTEEFISENYHLVENDTARQCTYAKEVADTIRDAKELDNFSALDKKIIIEIFYLIKLKKEIEVIINSDHVDGDSLYLELMFLSDALEKCNETSAEYKLELREDIMPSTSNISILDVYGLTFDVDKFNDKEKVRLENLLKSLDAGNHDYIVKNGDHSKMIQDVIRESVYINRDYKTAISYIRVTPDKALVLHSSNGDIFKETNSILKKNRLSIEKQLELIKDNDEGYIKLQTQILSNLLSKIEVEDKEVTR